MAQTYYLCSVLKFIKLMNEELMVKETDVSERIFVSGSLILVCGEVLYCGAFWSELEHIIHTRSWSHINKCLLSTSQNSQFS